MCGHGTVALMTWLADDGVFTVDSGGKRVVELRTPDHTTSVALQRRPDGRLEVMLTLAGVVFESCSVGDADLAPLFGTVIAGAVDAQPIELAVAEFSHLVVPVNSLEVMRSLPRIMAGLKRFARRSMPTRWSCSPLKPNVLRVRSTAGSFAPALAPRRPPRLEPPIAPSPAIFYGTDGSPPLLKGMRRSSVSRGMRWGGPVRFARNCGCVMENWRKSGSAGLRPRLLRGCFVLHDESLNSLRLADLRRVGLLQFPDDCHRSEEEFMR